MLRLLRRLLSDERSSGALAAEEEREIGPLHGPSLPMTIGEVWRPRSLRELGGDQSGAMMVMGIFMAMMLVGMVYYVAGIGDAIVYRERMQDAADSAAFASAVLHARGMNFIVLINIIMAALLAILVALKLVETLAWIGIFACYAIAALSFGTASGILALVPPLQTIQQTTSNLYNTLKQPIFTALRVCDTTQTVIARVVPVVAQARVVQLAADVYAPTTQIGFAWPLYKPLPTVDDSFDVLCERAGQTAGDLAMMPFFFLPGKIKDAISDALGSLAGTFSQWFCGSGGSGGGGGEPPSVTYDVVTPLPDNPAGDSAECARSRTDDSADRSACDRYQAWYEAGERCAMSDNPPESCSSSDRTAYEQRLAAGRSDCRGSDRENFVWQTTRYYRTERWVWVPGAGGAPGHWDYHLSAPSIIDNGPGESGCAGGRSGSGTCCSTGYACGNSCIELTDNCVQPGVLEGSSTRAIASDDEELPCGSGGYEGYQAGGPFVCAQEIATRGCDCPGTGDPSVWDGCSDSREGGGGMMPNGFSAECAGPPPGSGGPTRIERTIEFTAVTHVLSCSMTREEELPVDDRLFEDGMTPPEEGNCDMCPKKLEDCAELGEERFQLRTFVLGDVSAARRADAGVRLAAWGREGGDTYSSVMNVAGRLSFAQAEYMFWHRGEVDGEDTTQREEWMWHMFWTARMRRFRIGGDDACGGGGSASGDAADTPDAACDGAAADGGSGSCDTGGGIGAFLSDAISHIIVH